MGICFIILWNKSLNCIVNSALCWSNASCDSGFIDVVSVRCLFQPLPVHNFDTDSIESSHSLRMLECLNWSSQYVIVTVWLKWPFMNFLHHWFLSWNTYNYVRKKMVLIKNSKILLPLLGILLELSDSRFHTPSTVGFVLVMHHLKSSYRPFNCCPIRRKMMK
jgi:hypothetical protein